MAKNILFNKLVSKMRVMSNKFSGALGNNKMMYGAFYSCSYSNFKNDPRPLIMSMGQYQGMNGKNYTHAFNTNYMSPIDKQWLSRTIYLLNKSGQIIDANTFYQMIKRQRPSMIESSYRVYFSTMLTGKMVCAGFTNMTSLVYKGGGIPSWLTLLNQNLAPSNTPNQMPAKIAMSTTELQERIVMAQNSVPLNQSRVVRPQPFGNQQPFGTSQPFGVRR